MQDIMPPVGAGAQLIQSYGATGFRIGNADYASSVLVLPSQTFAWDGALTSASLLACLTQAQPPAELPEILLVGTGAQHRMLDPALRQALKAHGIVVDTMDTGAACRTFNVLLGEGRRIAAALVLPEH